jgi:hypothetical protein
LSSRRAATAFIIELEALLISLRNNGVLTAAQYEETLKERQAPLERGH